MPKQPDDQRFSLKDHLFNRERIDYLGELFFASDNIFDRSGFVRDCSRSLANLELKQRITHIACVLENYLSSDFRLAAKQITRALPPALDSTLSDGDFGDFIFAPLGEYVVRNGLEKKYLRLSLATLKSLTQRFSMEDAIRAFINAYPTETLDELTRWSTHRNYHVRRLVSEGTRAMLPWSRRLSLDVRTPLPLLDALHADRTRYVTRSVANHLNDISKTQPSLVLDTLRRWKKMKKQSPAELQWMSKHALRTLVKRGDPHALEFLGFAEDPQISLTDFALRSNKICAGEAIEFSVTLSASRDSNLLVDYVIDFVKARGGMAPKVYKWKQVQLREGESLTIQKRHILRAQATTYTLYPGLHRLTLQINGKPAGTQSFDLSIP